MERLEVKKLIGDGRFGHGSRGKKEFFMAAITAIEANGSMSLATINTGRRWYAVHTLPLNELRAEQHLNNQRFRTFMPKRLKTVRHARKTSTIEAPFFPRYLFVALDISSEPWRPVNGTFGVSRLVMRGDEPQAVPHGVVEALIASSDDRGILQFGPSFKIGGPVRLMAGPFADQLGILDYLDDAGRVRVLLDILGRQVRIATRAAHLLPLADPISA